MTPCDFRFGVPHKLDRNLPPMIDALRAGDYVPVVDEAGDWKLTDDRAMLRHVRDATPRIRFSSRIGSRPEPARAVEAALASLAPHGPLLPLGDVGMEEEIDALMRIVGSTCSAPWLIEAFRLVHGPSPWLPLRVERRVSVRERADVPADGEGWEHVPTSVQAQWASRVEEGSTGPIAGFEIEPFMVSVKRDWSPDPMKAMRTLRTAEEWTTGRSKDGTAGREDRKETA